MQRLSGLLLMFAGACVGIFGYLAPERDQAADLAEVTRISAAPDRTGAIAGASGVGSFSPTSPAFQQRTAWNGRRADDGTGAGRPPTWTTVVSVEGAGPGTLKTSAPGDWQTRAELTRDILKELKRVGCYGGIVTDAWTFSARDAMSAFTNRVNASLPVNEPDYILLNLLQSYRGIACGTPCPTGQVSGGDGRCVPQAVVAQATRKSKRLEERRLAAARLDGERGATTQLEKVASLEPEKLPWVEASTATSDVPQPVTPSEPLPGRMSVGGPDAGLPPPAENMTSVSITTDPVDGDDLTEIKPAKSNTKRSHKRRDDYAYNDGPPRSRYREPARGSVHYMFVHPLGFN